MSVLPKEEENDRLTLHSNMRPDFQIKCQHCGSSYIGLVETTIGGHKVKHKFQCFRPSCYEQSILQVHNDEDGVKFEIYKG